MSTPCPARLTHFYIDYEDEWNPRGRRDLTPIFELGLPPTPPPTPVKQKSYFGKVRLIKADI
jgi:hypothetical protein